MKKKYIYFGCDAGTAGIHFGCIEEYVYILLGPNLADSVRGNK